MPGSEGTAMILLAVVLAIVVGGLVVPFGVGFVRGPRPASGPAGPAAAPAVAAPLRPLGAIAGIYGRFLLLYLALAIFEAKDGFYGHGVRQGAACVDTGIGASMSAGGQSWRARPGTLLGPAGNLEACVLHPTARQWALFALTEVPSLLLWGGVLLVIVRLVRHAARNGPFTPRGAAMMRQLGWLILAGCAVVGALRTVGADALTDAVVAPQPFNGAFIATDTLLRGPLSALLPVPALAGIALLSFASITRAGAVMDEELRATV